VNVNDGALYLARQEASREILDDLWTIGAAEMNARPGDESVSLFIQTLNDTIDLQTSRSVTVVQARVPETILVLLFPFGPDADTPGPGGPGVRRRSDGGRGRCPRWVRR
jgi:hypothetical protein